MVVCGGTQEPLTTLGRLRWCSTVFYFPHICLSSCLYMSREQEVQQSCYHCPVGFALPVTSKFSLTEFGEIAQTARDNFLLFFAFYLQKSFIHGFHLTRMSWINKAHCYIFGCVSKKAKRDSSEGKQKKKTLYWANGKQGQSNSRLS